MLSVQLNKLGKKFNKEWIFRDLTYEIAAGQKTVVLGGNGSGKSTLLQVISGFVTPNEGTVTYTGSGSNILPEKIKSHISFASPYLQLVEELTLIEMLEHAKILNPLLMIFRQLKWPASLNCRRLKINWSNNFQAV